MYSCHSMIEQTTKKLLNFYGVKGTSPLLGTSEYLFWYSKVLY